MAKPLTMPSQPYSSPCDQVCLLSTSLRIFTLDAFSDTELARRNGVRNPLPLSLGPGFRLAARWNRLVETVKTRKKREENGAKMGEIRSKKCGRSLR